MDQFDSLDAFDTYSSWVPQGELVRSGEGETVLKISVFLVMAGRVDFTYKVVAEGMLDQNRNGGLYFTLDGSNLLSGVTSTFFDYVTFSYPLSAGTHVLTWKFVGGQEPSSGSRGLYAAIDLIVVDGVQIAARQPILCKEGTFQNETRQTMCLECAEDTFSGAGREECLECEEKHYSLPGSGDCSVATRCTEEDDYTVVYSLCSAEGKRTKTILPLQPKTCYDDETLTFPTNNTEEDCPPCPPGFAFSSLSGGNFGGGDNDDDDEEEEEEEEEGSKGEQERSEEEEYECVPCGLDTIEKDGKCENIEPGSYSTLQITYFNSGDYLQPGFWGEGEWPVGHNSFSSMCRGKCGNSGWRIVDNTAESGFHGVQGEVESILTLEQELVHEGVLSFEYKISAQKTEEMAEDTSLAGLQFFTDGELEDGIVVFHPPEDQWMTARTTLLPAGRHFFQWIFHQPIGTNRHKRATLRNIQVSGSSEGGGGRFVTLPRWDFLCFGWAGLSKLSTWGTLRGGGVCV